MIALVDFCETLVKFQTFDPYILCVLKKNRGDLYKIANSSIFKKICYYATKLLRNVGYKGFVYKTLIVHMTKGIKEEEFVLCGKEYYEDIVKPKLIMETLELLEKLKTEGYTIYIVSGGSKYYIEYFAKENNIVDVITTEMMFKNGKSQGKIIDDCLGEKKVESITAYVANNEIEATFEIGITDSITDLPMLNLCKRKVIVSKGTHQKWVTEDMEEIVWES